MKKVLVYTTLYLGTLGIILSSFFLKVRPLDGPGLMVLRSLIVCFATVLLTKYVIYMVLCPWYGAREKREHALITYFQPRYEPLVSVLIPAWNEEVGLLKTVKTLLSGTYRRLEIIVVNDGSTDGSDTLMRTFVQKYERQMRGVPHPRLLYQYKPNGGKGSALNAAIRLASGEILLSIDADCIVHEQAVESFVTAFRDPRVMAAVGNVKIGNTQTLVGTVQFLEYLFGFYFKKADSLLGTIYIIGGAAGAFRREVFQRLGGYSTTNITEDIELSVRIQRAGMKIVYVPEALVYTEGASTVKGLMKQRLRWKRGRIQTFLEHRSLFFSLRPEHNKLLTWMVLPLALFGDVQISFEPLFLVALYIFSFLSGDFSSFLSGVIVVSLMFTIQAFDSRHEQGIAYILLAPIGWALFYLMTFVEFYALTKSLWLALHKQEVTWQKWQRTGMIGRK